MRLQYIQSAHTQYCSTVVHTVSEEIKAVRLVQCAASVSCPEGALRWGGASLLHVLTTLFCQD